MKINKLLLASQDFGKSDNIDLSTDVSDSSLTNEQNITLTFLYHFKRSRIYCVICQFITYLGALRTPIAK